MNLNRLCEECKYKCKMNKHIDIVNCKFIEESKEAKQLAKKCTKEWEENKKKYQGEN